MSNKNNPNFFKNALKCYRAETSFLYISYFLMLFSLILQYRGIEIFRAISELICLVVIAILPGIKFNRMRYQGKADENRRKDFVDNSFGTGLSVQNTKGYYDNEEQIKGLYKALVNVFENTFFSANISSHMLKKVKEKNVCCIIASFVFVIASVWVNNIAVTIYGLFYIVWFVQEIESLNRYTKQVNELYNKIESLFYEGVSKKAFKERHFEGRVVHFLIEYEVNIAENKVMLDSNIFNRLNESLTLQWAEMKNNFNIE